MSKAGQVILGMALGAACMGAVAQTVYRCASAYSQAPCAGGQAIDTSETLQTRQPGQGPSAAQRDAKAAAALERERLRLEAGAAPAFIPQPRQPATQRPKADDKPRKLEQFKAVAPARADDEKKKPKKKKKAAAKA